ncbi:zinc finger BED domain-containing protein RICESLEEPER 2 [Tanacetum coccineum]
MKRLMRLQMRLIRMRPIRRGEHLNSEEKETQYEQPIKSKENRNPNVGNTLNPKVLKKMKRRVTTKMAYCKWCPAVFKADSHRHDEDWVMHKIIINFRPIHSHRGVDIGRALLECITGWGIKNVMTVTVDNISSNDKALEYLVENLPTKYDNGTPKRADFEVCRKVVQFLKKFKETTELVSNVSSPVAHLWFGEVLDIDKHLREWQANASFKDMIVEMRKNCLGIGELKLADEEDGESALFMSQSTNWASSVVHQDSLEAWRGDVWLGEVWSSSPT